MSVTLHAAFNFFPLMGSYDDDDDEDEAHESEETESENMKYYIEYRNENGTTTKKTPLLTADKIKVQFRTLMAKGVVIERVRTEDHDTVDKPGPSEYDASRKFRLKYRKEGKTIVRYTPWGTMDGTQNKFYRKLGKFVFLGIEEKGDHGAVPEHVATRKQMRKQKEDAAKANKALKKEVERHHEARRKLKKKRTRWFILLGMIGIGLIVLCMFWGALSPPSDVSYGSVASNVSSSAPSESVEETGLGAIANVMPLLMSGIIVVVIIAMVLSMITRRY